MYEIPSRREEKKLENNSEEAERDEGKSEKAKIEIDRYFPFVMKLDCLNGVTLSRDAG